MIDTLFLPLALAFIMFSLGLSLRVADFRAVLGDWRALGVGLVAQVFLLPLVALAIGLGLGLSPTMLLGLVILAACPGGVSSAFLTHLARGNTALSLVMTTISSLLAALTLPLVINLLMLWQAGDLPAGALFRPGDMPLGKLLAGVLLVTTLPVVVGMLLRLRAGLIGERGEAWVSRLATGFFIAIVVVTFISHRQTIVAGLPEVGAATVLLNVVAMLGGALLAWAAGLARRENIAISLECGLQNAGMGIFVAISLFRQAELAVPSVVYALTMNLGALAFLYFVRRQRAGGLALP
ncbi:bile acid:sodium symporter family protein [Azonexus hydrophilus]|uniref:bile acid:sodium symporter family protein n=1 Tax=Azonexus hydrophilus TaxID=418702 RepID=UPI00040451F4|nr:bile acid:sodium symporter family protein [Azonexus hydrophilus]